MPEPFKNLFSKPLIEQMAAHLQRVEPRFDAPAFIEQASRDLDALELMDRSRQIATALGHCLPRDFLRARKAVLASLHPEEQAELSQMVMDERGIRGWAIMPIGQYVAAYGMHHYDEAMELLKALTKRFSAEFAVRPFIAQDQARAFTHLARWAQDANVHVRRLASEGSRPRLPWGQRLPALIQDPSPLMPLLMLLRDDSSEYVRRSVANNLNDIAKDHPDWLVEQLGRHWAAAGAHRKRLMRHGCRTLVKAGHPGALRLLGYDTAQVRVDALQLAERKVLFGENLGFSVQLQSTSARAQQLVVDYVVYLRKANGALSPKVFKWKQVNLPAGERLELAKQHSFRAVTTRRYYPGEHALAVQINGVQFAKQSFTLVD